MKEVKKDLEEFILYDLVIESSKTSKTKIYC